MLRSRVKELEKKVEMLKTRYEISEDWRIFLNNCLLNRQAEIYALMNHLSLKFEKIPATTPKLVVVSTKEKRRNLTDAERIKAKIHTTNCSYLFCKPYCDCNGRWIKGRAKELMTKIHKNGLCNGKCGCNCDECEHCPKKTNKRRNDVLIGDNLGSLCKYCK